MTNHPEKFAELVATLSQYDARQLEAVEESMKRIAGLDDGRTREMKEEKESDARPSHFKEIQRIQSGTRLPHSKDSQGIPSDARPSHSKDWPRAPLHRLEGKGAFIVTAGTLNKSHRFHDVESLDYLESELLTKAKEYDWQLEAWAVFSNHYHFVGQALVDAESLRLMLTHLHSDTARWLNERDDEPERQVWYNFWETKLTYEKSYQARLHYVHRNPVKHGLVLVANQYRWCSAAWFERTATPAQVKTIYSFKTDKIKIVDDYNPLQV
jgi:putative transposase